MGSGERGLKRHDKDMSLLEAAQKLQSSWNRFWWQVQADDGRVGVDASRAVQGCQQLGPAGFEF